jgi:serine/threonine-protein kinase
VVGTPEYMSPEQARGGKIDHRSDIYALGIVAFELFTGGVPFRGETPLATIFMHLQEPPPLEGPGAEGLPPSVVPVLRKALAKDPDERFSTAAEFAAAITQARDAAGVAPLARRSSAPGPRAGVGIPRTGGATAEPLPSPTLDTLEAWPTVAARSGPTVGPPASSQPTLAPASRPTRVVEPPRGEAPRRRDAAPPPKRGTAMVAGIAGAVVLVAVGGFALLRHQGAPSPTPTSAPATTVPPPSSPAAVAPAGGPNGTLVIDAVPWGEVVEVVDESGRHHEPGGARYTPLAIALPPGTYSVQVRNPRATEPLARVATVRSQTVERVSVVFRRVDAQDYLQKTGF